MRDSKTTTMSFGWWLFSQTAARPRCGVRRRRRSGCGYSHLRDERLENFAELKKEKRVRKVTYCTTPFIHHFWNDEIIEMENRLVVVGLGLWVRRKGVQRGGGPCVPYLDCGCGQAIYAKWWDGRELGKSMSTSRAMSTHQFQVLTFRWS